MAQQIQKEKQIQSQSVRRMRDEHLEAQTESILREARRATRRARYLTHKATELLNAIERV